MAFPSNFAALRRTLSNRDFAMFTAGSLVSVIGTWMQRVAVGWLTWELTHSAAWLGAVAAAEFLPTIVVAPIVGALADRYDRRSIALVGQILATLQASLLAALTITGFVTPMWIFLLQLSSGFFQPATQTARLVLVPSLVPRENLGNAVAISSLTFNIARILGPGLSGLMIATMGAGYSFAANAASYLGVIASLMAMTVPPRAAAQASTPSFWGAVWADIGEGARYTFTHADLRVSVVLIGICSLLAWPLSDLMAGIADLRLGQGVEGLALLTSAQGVGAIGAGLFVAQRSNHEDALRIAIACSIAGGIALSAFGANTIFWLALPLVAVFGFLMVLASIGTQTATQMVADERMRARTISTWYTVTRVGLALGALIQGAAASITGFAAPLITAGALTAIAGSYFYLSHRRD
ncbi:MAG: MFS transporter [Rhodospirillaceae bacterium]